MPRLHEARRDSGGDLDGRVERHRAKALHRLLDLSGVVERFDGRFARPRAFAVGALDIEGLHLRRVAQDEAGEIERGLGGENGAGVAALDEQRKPPGVIEMRVGDEHRIEPVRLQSGGNHVLRLGARAALEEPKIHEHPRAADFDEIGRAGHFTGGAVQGDFDGAGPGLAVRFHSVVPVRKARRSCGDKLERLKRVEEELEGNRGQQQTHQPRGDAHREQDVSSEVHRGRSLFDFAITRALTSCTGPSAAISTRRPVSR